MTHNAAASGILCCKSENLADQGGLVDLTPKRSISTISHDSPPVSPQETGADAYPSQNAKSPLSHGDQLAALRSAITHRERQIEAMSRISTALFTRRDVDELVRETLTIAMQTVGASAGSVQMYEERTDQLVFRHVVGPASERLQGYAMPSTQGISGSVFHSGKSDITGDVRQSRTWNRSVDDRTGYITESMATVPIKRQGMAPLGVMQILNFSESYDEFDLEVLEVIAGQAALAIENARLENQAHKAAMVNLIGDVSHDIKNMLTPIQTGAWTLDPLLRQTFEKLRQLSVEMPLEWGEQVEQTIKLAREEYPWILQNALDATTRVHIRTKEIADAVKGVSSPARFVEEDFNELCQEVITSLYVVAYDRKVELHADLDETLPHVQFDHSLLYNALYNLVNNAIPETPEGGRVTLRSRHLGPRETNFLIEVADNGRGMSSHIRERLFTDDTISTKPGGTGLGTRIVADVVRRHRGHIAVQSELGFGTTFTILLPKSQEI